MQASMLIQTFTGDHASTWRNRLPNEILLTAQRPGGTSITRIIPGAILVQLAAPTSRTLVVTAVVSDGSALHIQVARYDDEPPVRCGVYLASFTAFEFTAPDFLTGVGLASILIDEDLPAIPRPPVPDPDPVTTAREAAMANPTQERETKS